MNRVRQSPSRSWKRRAPRPSWIFLGVNPDPVISIDEQNLHLTVRFTGMVGKRIFSLWHPRCTLRWDWTCRSSSPCRTPAPGSHTPCVIISPTYSAMKSFLSASSPRKQPSPAISPGATNCFPIIRWTYNVLAGVRHGSNSNLPSKQLLHRSESHSLLARGSRDTCWSCSCSCTGTRGNRSCSWQGSSKTFTDCCFVYNAAHIRVTVLVWVARYVRFVSFMPPSVYSFVQLLCLLTSSNLFSLRFLFLLSPARLVFLQAQELRDLVTILVAITWATCAEMPGTIWCKPCTYFFSAGLQNFYPCICRIKDLLCFGNSTSS